MARRMLPVAILIAVALLWQANETRRSAREFSKRQVVFRSEAQGATQQTDGDVSGAASVAIATESTKPEDSIEDGYSIRGRVVDPSGRPIAGAIIGIGYPALLWGGAWPDFTHVLRETEQKTNASGCFTLQYADACEYVLVVWRRGYESTRVFVTAGDQTAKIVLQPGDEGNPFGRSKGSTVAKSERMFRAQILTNGGWPLANARVVIDYSRARTDRTGRVQVRLKAAPGDEIAVEVETNAAIRLAGGKVSVQVPEAEQTEVHMRLPAPQMVTLRVTGAPAELVKIKTAGYFVGRAGHDFRFAMSPGEQNVEVSAPGYLGFDEGLTPRDGDLYQIGLARESVVTGRLLGRDGRPDGRPVIGLDVGKDGRFRIVVAAGWHVLSIREGGIADRWTVVPAVVIEFARVFVTPGGVVALGDLFVPPCCLLSGLVTGVDGKPAGGVQILALRRGLGRAGHAITRPDGRFSMVAFGESFRVIAWKRSRGVAMSAVVEADAELKLRLVPLPRVYVEHALSWGVHNVQTADGFPLPNGRVREENRFGPVPPGRVQFRFTLDNGSTFVREITAKSGVKTVVVAR